MDLFILLFSFFLNNGSSPFQDETVYYARISNVRNYMNVDRSTVTEYWSGKDKSCFMTSQVKIVTRNDLGARYTINYRTNTYRIDSLGREIRGTTQEEVTDIKYAGEYYTPVYEWWEMKELPRDTIGSIPCKHFLARGDADFDMISLEFWVTETEENSVAFMLNNSMIAALGSENKSEPAFGILNPEKSLVLMKVIEKVENPIAPPVTTTLSIEVLKRLEPEKGLFDIPENFSRIN